MDTEMPSWGMGKLPLSAITQSTHPQAMLNNLGFNGRGRTSSKLSKTEASMRHKNGRYNNEFSMLEGPGPGYVAPCAFVWIYI